jgi:tetratricopeptide (TPR) repeat protein
MAHTTLDLTPRTTRRSDDDQNRAATFRRANVPGEDLSDDAKTTARRAAYRPREEVAIRRDVVEQFRNRLERDATHTPDNPDAVAAALFGIARAEESLGRFEEARQALSRLENVCDFSPVVWALSRRLYRQEGREDRAIETLQMARKSAAEEGQDALAVLIDLELARHAWLEGESADEIIGRVDTLPDEGGDYTALWKTRLHLDALLERGASDWALGVVGRDLEHIDDPKLRDMLRMRAAIWSAVWGDLDDATSLLEEVRRNGNLDGDLGEFLGSLYFDLGRRDKATELFETSEDLEQTDVVSAAMLQETVANSPKGADAMLGSLIRREPEDWTALRVRETHLERYFDRHESQDELALDKPGESLIDVYNLQLEGPLSTQERVTKLTRLGRLYECEAGLEEAAAEVYREALALEADHVPALRALGRLYARRDNWAGLADLYEREIANMAGAPSVWRRHFQLAEIYRVRLENAVRALEHYRQVLEHRPHYLPALKAAAGLLGELGRWSELADLFLASVEVAPNRRQKLYLLDKVAEVAENELQNYEVAIGAWQEILLLDDQHPRAFAALGRLYAKTGQWNRLIELNMREIELVEDLEEEAVLRQKCAEIAERHLEDLDLAEKHYRAALDVLPDFLPALEGLGRIYMRKERWDDIIEMSGRELQQTDDLREAIRRLGALAEIFETRLDRREDAIRIYERILELDPSDAHAIESAIRLNYTLERWPEVIELTERKLVATSEPRAFASLQGELGMIAEWHQNDLGKAYARYLAALDAEPANAHWLAGVARCWSAAGQDADAVADRLEDNVMKPMSAEVRDRYFKVIARLRERAYKSADASRAYRMHGSSESLENQLVLQLAMAQGGERKVLQQFRRANPHHALERLLDVNRSGLTVGDAEAVRDAIDALDTVEREALLAELPVSVAAEFSRPEDTAELRLSAELVRVLEGEALKGQFDDSTTDPLSLRLRGIEARQSNDFEAYVFWTRRELELRDSRDLKVSRLTEVAEFAASRGRRDDTVTFLEEAARQAFPERHVEAAEGDVEIAELEGAIEGAQDGPTLDRLYQAIRAAELWELLRDCLEAHSLRGGLTRSRRLYLFRTLAEVYEQKLEDFDGASTALSHCWQLSEDVTYLRELVRVSMSRDDLDRAIRFQQRHFEHVTEADSSPEECVQSGLWLAELLLQDEERIEDGVDCLEHLLATYLVEQSSTKEGEENQELALFDDVRRNLAYAYDQLGNAYRAVEYFQQVLGNEVDEGELADWRQLVEVYNTRLDDRETAYELQWKIVESGLGGADDLEMVVDLAFGADCLDDCAERLEDLAENVDGERRRDLLARAAGVIEEDLMWPEEAVRLYTAAITCCENQCNEAEGSDTWVELVRRRAFCLAQIAGREHEALEEFRKLVVSDPYEPTTYRGMSDLLERCQAFDRARVSKQILRVLDCAVEIEEPRTKTNPTRPISREQIEKHLLPDELTGGMVDVLQAAMPLVEKVWSDELPQRKALEGVRLKKLDATDVKESLQAALEVFGITRFKAESGDSGPTTPQVFAGSSPYVWLHGEQIEKMQSAELRFIAGYSAALAWSGLPALLAVDGRRVWHLIEAVLLKQTGEGFDERVDMATQNLVDTVSSPFHTVARRRLMAALDPAVDTFGDVHCEIWPRAVEQFACRVGLVLSGDVRAAVRGLLSFHGWDLPLDAPETQKQIRRNEEVQRLMAFAMSDDYLEARYAFGLAGKPSRIVK